MKKIIKIEGMSCGHCSNAVLNALKGISGVSDVNVNLEAKEATLEADGTVTDAAITAAVTEEGYEVVSIA